MIETSFVIKNVDVDTALKEAERKAEKSAKKIDNTLTNTGDAGKKIGDTLQQASKGMDAVSKAGGKAGGVLKNITSGIAGMMNPIGLVSAGITAVTALIVHMYEAAKEKAEKLFKTLQWEAKEAQRQYSNLLTEHGTDKGYMQRLEEINRMENVDNATKIEATRIIEHLTQKYGDLGLSIDMATGKIIGLTGATKKQAQAMLDAEKVSMRAMLEKQRGVVQTGIQKELNVAKGNPTQAQIVGAFNPISVEENLGMLRTNGQTAYVDMQMQEEIYAKHTPKAVSRYVGIVGLEEAQRNKNWEQLKQYYEPEKNATKEEKEIMTQIASVSRQIKSTTDPTDLKNLREQYDTLQKMLTVQRQIQTAYEIQHDPDIGKDEAEHWRNVREEAIQYYAMLNKLRNALKVGNEMGKIENPDKSQGRTQTQVDSAYKAADASWDRLKQKQTEARREKLTRPQLIQELKYDNSDLLRKISTEENELDKLDARYEELTKILAVYEKMQQNGKFPSSAIETKYLEISKQRLEIDEKIAKVEKQVADDKIAQIDLQKRITQEETKLIEEQKKQREEQQKLIEERKKLLQQKAKETLGKMFSGILGDYREHTNSLIARGASLRGVNTSMNVAQINRQILNTVMTANQYLSRINTQINGVGNI